MENENINKDIFEKQPIRKSVWKLALPTIASMLVTVLYNLADTFFVGQTNDKSQVAAVSLVMPVFLIFMAFGNLFGMGGGSAISRFLGEKRQEDVRHVSSFSFYGSIIVGIILGAIALIFMPQIVPLTGATTGTNDYIKEYLTYIAIGAPFLIVSNAFGNIVRSVGSAKLAMIGMMIGTVVNIILDPIMILAMDIGVTGAAVATVIGNIASTIFYVILLMKKNNILSVKPKDFKIKGIGATVLAIGIPACLNNILMSIASIIFNVFLSKYGEAPIAAMGIAMKVNMLAIMLFMGLTMGAQPLIGYNYGSGNHDRMKKVIWYIMRVSVIMGTIVMIVFLVFAKPIVTSFIDDKEVIYYGTKMLRILSSTSFALGIMFVSMSALQSMGKALASLILSISRQGFIFLPVAIITNWLFKLDGLMWAQPISDLFSITISVILLIWILKKYKTDKHIKKS